MMYALVNEKLSDLYKQEVNLSNGTYFLGPTSVSLTLLKSSRAWSLGLYFEAQCFTIV